MDDLKVAKLTADIVPRLREAAQVIRALLAGETVAYASRSLTIDGVVGGRARRAQRHVRRASPARDSAPGRPSASVGYAMGPRCCRAGHLFIKASRPDTLDALGISPASIAAGRANAASVSGTMRQLAAVI